MATTKMFSAFPLNALKKLIYDLSDNTNTHIKLMLLTNVASPNQETWTSKAEVTNEVAPGGGYTAGGAELATKALTEATRVTKFDGDDVSWANSTITARYAVLYDNSAGSDALRKLILWIDFGTDQSSNNTEFKITWDNAGIFTFTVPA